MKKLKVNTDGCIGCGACFSMDPEHFTCNEEGFSIVKSEENIDLASIRNVIAACPVDVISYEEECTCDDCHCNEEASCGCNETFCTCNDDEKAA